jgi:excisionase family DNA binding protein
MPTVRNTIADFRRWLLDRMDELDRLYEHPAPDESLWSRCLDVVQEAGDLAARRGITELLERSRSFDGATEPMDAKAFLSDCVTVIASQPRIPDPEPPHFDGGQAADYLGITMGSLQGLVDRRRLIPLRGPRNSYRFTREKLDEYLHATT